MSQKSVSGSDEVEHLPYPGLTLKTLKCWGEDVAIQPSLWLRTITTVCVLVKVSVNDLGLAHFLLL